MIRKSSHGTVPWVPFASVRVRRSVLPSKFEANVTRGKQENTHGHFGTCNNTCCAISVSAFAPTADEGVAAAVDAEAAADVEDSGTVGGIVPMG